MKRARRPSADKGAIELVEEAVHLLRRASFSTLAIYFVGTMPFVAGMLYFWAEMSRSPFAYQHLAGESLAIAALFIWMKVWQARFARALWSQIAGQPEPQPGGRGWVRLLASQAALQASGLIVLPLSLILTIPFGWVYAFYQNLSAVADPGDSDAKDLFSRARRHAFLWPGQNHAVLSLLFAFALFVFLNWIIVSLSIPMLAKTLFGIETVFSRSPVAMLNSTFLATMFALTYLSIDPLVKAVYTLRCFYGEGRTSGADIKAELKQLTQTASAILGVLILLFTAQPALSAQTEVIEAAEGPSGTKVIPERPAQTVNPSISSSDLDQEITETLKHPKYAWRFPREEVEGGAETKSGLITRFFERIRQWFSSIGEWLRKLFRPKSAQTHVPAPGPGSLVHFYMFVLIAAVAVGLALLLFRVLRNRNGKQGATVSTPIQPSPDLSDENVGAEQLPEDGWSALGRELLQRGELRLAMRAFYLASLAHLASRSLISLARFKSNRDYSRELERRAHAFPELPRLFTDNVSVFDRVWYGMHQIDSELVGQFLARVETIKAK
jgi:Domain of unknown function (DUF4129)